MSISKVEFLNASSSLIIVKIKTEKLGWKIARRFKFSKSAKNYNLKSILVSDRLRGGTNFDPVKYVKEVSHVEHMHANLILVHFNFSSKLMVT